MGVIDRNIKLELDRLNAEYEREMETCSSFTSPFAYEDIRRRYQRKRAEITDRHNAVKLGDLQSLLSSNERVTHSVEEPSRRQRRKKLASLIKVDC